MCHICKPQKPPIGVMPRRIWEDFRRSDLKRAIQNYLNAGFSVPMEWLEEYNELTRKLNLNNQKEDTNP